MRNGLWVLDADAHQMEPAAMRAEYITPPYRDQAPRVVENDGRLLFDTDDPHSGATWPGDLDALEAQPLSAESLRRIFWDNGAAAFGLTPPAATVGHPAPAPLAP